MRSPVRVRAFIAALSLASSLAPVALHAKSRPAPAPVTLSDTLARAAAGGPARGGGVSISVVELDTGSTVFERNPSSPETIASITKLFSSAAALHYLGPDYRFRTTFWRRGEVHDGVLMGSLLVVGGGDPNISGRFYEDDSFAIFDRWTEGLRQAGILRVAGDLILNAGAFDNVYRHPDWPESRDSRWYQAPISALSYNDNCVLVSVGRDGLPGAPTFVDIDPDTDLVQSVGRPRTVGKAGRIRVAVSRPSGSNLVKVSGTVPSRYFRWSNPLAIDDPPKFFGAALRSRMASAGIGLVGSVLERDVPADNSWLLIATTESNLLPTLAVANKRSQSFYAEQIFKTLAYEKTGRGSWDRALDLTRQFIAGLGLDPGAYALRDGSGLSDGNRVAAGDLVRFLRAMNAHPQGAAWRATLAVAGEQEGSLRHRLLWTSTRGQIEAKTGTLNGVSTLAGYATASSGKTYAFAILLNGPRVTESRGHAFQDRLLKALVERG
ncbi:MAG: D-alanyl-D-alanine carboxypeptidase/D-alanyl-D-alanine-endopeptidase [Thermoanaerobaculia bacterium]